MPAARARRRRSLAWRVPLVACIPVVLAVGAMLVLTGWLGDPLLAAAVTLAILLPITISAVRSPLSPMMAMFRALAGTVTSYRDGDFAFSLAWKRNDELGDLVAAHNALGDTLRRQRAALVHRELLLDTMVQNTPVAMLLCDPGGHIVYGNLAVTFHPAKFGIDWLPPLPAPLWVRDTFLLGGMFTGYSNENCDYIIQGLLLPTEPGAAPEWSTACPRRGPRRRRRLLRRYCGLRRTRARAARRLPKPPGPPPLPP